MSKTILQNPGPLSDGDLELILREAYPGNPEIGWVPAYRFNMHLTGTPTVVGNIELRVGNTEPIQRYGGHIGYNVEPAYRGRQFAARACRLLLPLARSHGLAPLWITCNPDNHASARTAERAGAVFVETVDLPADNEMYQNGERQKNRYKIELNL